MPDYSAGQAYLTVLPSLTGFGDRVREQLAKEDFSVDVPIKPKVDPAEAAKQGDEYGGAFGDTARKRIEAALKALPKAQIDADSSDADRKIDELRTRLEELRDKRIGVDISGADALAELKAIHAELDEVGSKNPRSDVRVNTAAAQAELAALNAEIQQLDGKRADFKVDDGGSSQKSIGDILNLMTAAVALGPAIIPVAAAVAGALGAIGIGAIAGVAGLGVLKLGFSDVSGAVTALGAAQAAQGQNAAQLAAQQISSANSVASAQDGVRNAVTAVTDAQRAAGIANTNAAQQVATAQRGLADAYIATGISIQGALDSQTRAEETLATAQRSELTAQQALTSARQAAQRQLESLAQQVADGALAERQATLDIQSAQLALDQTKANPAASLLQREQAQLTYDQAVQHLSDLQVQNKNLAQDKAAADKAGVDGSQQVIAAQNAVTSATTAVTDAQRALKTASDNVVEAQRSGAEKILVAQQQLATAQAAQAETARAGLENVAKAEQGVISAQRSLQNALAQQAAQAASTTSAVTALQQAMAKLSPTGQEFAKFLFSLKPQLDSLKAAAQDGLLPGVETGIKALLPLMPQLTTFVGGMARAMGDMAAQAGRALTSPYWQQFFGFIQSEAAPSLRIFGQVLGNLATGFAGVLEAFRPVWDQMGRGILDLTAGFAAFGQTAGTNGPFQQFLAYVQAEGPVVASLIGNLVTMFVRLGEALGPLGGEVLGLVTVLVQLFNAIPQSWLNWLVPGLVLLYDTVKLIQLGILGWTALTAGITKIGTAITAVKDACILTRIELAALWVQEQIVTGFTAAWGAITAAITAVKDACILTRIELAAIALWDGIVAAATGVWTAAQWLLNVAMDANPIGIVILAITALVAIVIVVATHFDFFKGIVLDCWHGIEVAAKWTWENVLKPIFDGIVWALKQVGDFFGWLWHNAVEPALHGIEDVANTVWTNGLKPVFDAIGWALGQVGNAFGNVVNWVRDHWGDLKRLAAEPVQFVVDVVYNNGIRAVWNGIASVFGLGQLNPVTINFADGGVLPGYAPGRDTVPALLSAGEGILVPEAVRGLGPQFVHDANRHFSGGRARSGGGPGFADGGVVGAIGSAISGAWDWTAGLFTDPIGTVKRLFSGVVGAATHIPGVGLLHNALTGLPGKVIDAVVAAAKNLIGLGGGASIGGTTEGGVTRWADVILQALAMVGAPPSLLPNVERRMNQESGGNPTIVNTTDSNWLAGTPSVGLMQVIGPTFRRYADQFAGVGPFEYGVSVNPLANTYAGLNYARHAYPSIQFAMDKAGGYDSGGWLPPGLTLAYNGTGQHERVLTGPQWQEISHGSRGGYQATFHITQQPDQSPQSVAALVDRQMAFAAR